MDYSKFDFPPYVFVEYPKWVESKAGPVIVQNADEELTILEELSVKKRVKES